MKFIPSDTLIHYAGGQVKKQVDADFQPNTSAVDIEEGLINMGDERFDDWLVGMSNLKVGRKRPELFYIDNSWPRNKKTDAFHARGESWYALGLYEKALADFRQAILLVPRDVHFYSISGDCEYKSGNYESAISYLDHVIELDPKYANAYNNRGWAKTNLGNYAEAIADCDKAIELDPKNTKILPDRLIAQRMLERYGPIKEDEFREIRLTFRKFLWLLLFPFIYFGAKWLNKKRQPIPSQKKRVLS